MFSQNYTVLMNVDMHGSGLTAGQAVYISGDFSGIYGYWNVPGSNPENVLSDADNDSVYSITMTLPANDFQFKFFRGTGWNDGEWGGIPNRNATVASDTTFATFIWGKWGDLAGIGINDNGREPDPSAMLDVNATDRGMLIPRISTDARDQIPSPATGLLIYNSITNQFNYFNGSYWHQLTSAFISSTVGTLSMGGGVSINTSANVSPENSAMLDINNPSRGILLPRTTPDLIKAPAPGLIIYNTSTNLLCYYDWAQWRSLCAISTGIAGAGGSQASVGMAYKTDNSGPHHSAMMDVSATDKGVLIPRLTNAQRDAILPVTGLVIYNTSANRIEFYNGSAWYRLVTDLPESPEAGAHVSSLTQVTWNWNPVNDATGYKWNTADDYGSAEDMGTDTAKTETAMACGTSYTRYAWAYNGCGFSTPVTLTQTTSDCFSCGTSLTINHLAGAVAPVDKTVTYGTVTNIPGEPSKCWITSNLGADQQATAVNNATEASAGWYWQFNRKQGFKHDGTTRTPDDPWITTIDENSDWIADNDPCNIELGSGWRIPTVTEWINVDAAGGWSDWNGPWNSGLKLHASGIIMPANGDLVNRGAGGNFWSNKQAASASGWYLEFYSGYSLVKNYGKSYGFAMRCILNCQDTLSPGTFSDDFESYTVGGYLAVQNPDRWTTWSNAPGTGEDATISNVFSSSPTKSVLVDDTGGATDLLLKLGDKSTGKYELQWMMYIESANAGYYNIQHFQSPGIEFAMEVYFRTSGTGELSAGSSAAIAFTYPKDNWFEVKHIIDLDADHIQYYVNGTLVHDWPFSYQALTTIGTNQLGAVDFFAGAESGSTPKYFLDDVSFIALPDHVTAADQVIWNWNPVANATGYKWNSTSDYDSGEDMGTSTTKTETGLTCGNGITRYVWAYNDCGFSAPIVLTQSTLPCFPCGSSFTVNHVKGAVAPVDKTVTYGTISKIPGEPSKCWITSNLGADHRAYAVDDATEASAGWYWQFNKKQGYKHDGTNRLPVTDWINNISENSDWTEANDPCSIELGDCWRIPTSTEWINVDGGDNWIDWNGPWNSRLKLHAAGYLSYNDGSLNQRGSDGDYWSSNQHAGTTGWFLGFNNSYSVVYNDGGSDGFPLRCLRDANSIIAAAEVTTTVVSDIRGDEAVGGGNVTGDGGSPVTARGICWSISANPTLADDYTIDGMGKGSFLSELDSLIANTTYYVRAYAANETDTVYGNEVSFSSWACGDPVTYSLDGKVYNTVLIGTQCWFSENLNVGTMVTDDNTGVPHTHCSDNGIIEKYCYDNDSASCEEYGGLYDWNEMMQYGNYAGSQGICPSGWHIPTNTEQATLTSNLGGESAAGGPMKETGTAHWNSPNTGATNSSGFTAFGSGYRGAEGFSADILSRAYYWLSNENSSEWSPAWYLDYQNSGLGLEADIKTCGFSVRCLQDGEGGDTLNPGAVIIDTTTSQLLSDSIQLSQGIYTYEFEGTPPPLEVGKIITGPDGDGYLRKVTGVSNSGNQVTVQTSQATMEELFNTADIGFESGISSPPGNAPGQPGNIRVKYLAKGVTVNMDEAEGFTFDFSNTPIYNEGNLSFTITDGSAVFNPSFTADIKYRWFKVSEFYIATKNSTLSVDCNVNLHASAGIPPINKEIELANINTKVPVPGVPVFVVINTQLTAKLEVTVDAAIDINTGFTDFYYASMGMKYIDHNWSKWCTVKDELDFAEPEVDRAGPPGAEADHNSEGKYYVVWYCRPIFYARVVAAVRFRDGISLSQLERRSRPGPGC